MIQCLSIFYNATINLRDMLLDPRTRLNQKKIAKTTASTLKTCKSLMSNPEVSAFYEKLEALAGDFPEKMWSPLNLMHWDRVKYHPTESQNRIRIQNRISMKRASHQKMRPRVKPVSRKSQSVQLFRQASQMTYQEHFSQIIRSTQLRKNHSEQIQSEEEAQVEIQKLEQPKDGVRFYHKLRKYKNVASYIQQRVQAKQTPQKYKKETCYSQKIIRGKSFSDSPEKRLSMTTKTTFGKSFEEDLKIDSIIKKWKPVSKIDKKFDASSSTISRRKRLSAKDISKPMELLLETPREPKLEKQTFFSEVQPEEMKNDDLI